MYRDNISVGGEREGRGFYQEGKEPYKTNPKYY